MITSGGDLQAGLIGAASAVAFFGVGRIGGIGNAAFGDLGHLGKIALHGAIGGLSSVAQGGKFKYGALSAGASAFAAPLMSDSSILGEGHSLKIAVSAIAGGTASSLGCGKFANGAVTGAMSYAFNAATQRTIAQRLADEVIPADSEAVPLNFRSH